MKISCIYNRLFVIEQTLVNVGAAEKTSDGYIVTLLPFGSESESAQRVRKFRAKKNEKHGLDVQKTLQSNATSRYFVTPRTTTDLDLDLEQQQQNGMEQIIDRFGVRSTVNDLMREGWGNPAIEHGLLLLSFERNARNPGGWLRRAVERGYTNPEAERRAETKRENEAITASAQDAMERELEQAATEEVTVPTFKIAMERHDSRKIQQKSAK